MATGSRGVSRRYRYATRLNSLKPVAASGRGTDLVRAAGRVRGLGALELNYPQHVTTQGIDELQEAIDQTGLPVTAVNLRYEGAIFANGAFTSPDPAGREAAVRTAGEAVEVAARLGADHVVVWLAEDGFDYPFQVEYARLWEHAVDGFRQVASRDPRVKVSVEAKPVDPRRFSLVRGIGEALLLVRDVDLPNMGVTLDFCHSLMAGEHPPAAAALALAQGRLFGVHLNDGYGRADDGLMAGSVHPHETVELLWLLRRSGYAGTIYFDTFPVREDPVAECEANIATVERLLRAVDRLDDHALAAAQARHDAVETQALVSRALWETGDV